MQIENHKVVTLHYTLKDDKGVTIDQSEDGSFVYLHGANNIISGLESALLGKAAGDEFDVTIEPENAYGLRNEDMLQNVPKEMFEDQSQVQVGTQFHAQSPDGDMLMVTVMEVHDDTVVVDGNHPLAGVQLNFDVKIIDVRDATEEEISHGHVHGPGGHHH